MRGKHIFLALSVLFLVLLLLLFLRHRHPVAAEAKIDQSSEPTVAIVPAYTGAIDRELSVAGVFQPFQEIDVHGKVSGYIRHIYVDIGDRVRQGQTLAVLEVPELQAQVAGAEAGVSQSKEDIARLDSNVAQQQAGYAAAHAQYLRLKAASGQQPGLVAAQELDDSAARDTAAAAQVQAAKSAVAAAQGQLGVSRADRQRVGSMAQYATITAPFAGVVTMRYADTGSLIPAGTSESDAQAVVRLAQSDVLRLRMPVPEQDVPLVQAGSTVRVRVQATGKEFPGTVVRFTRDISGATRTMMTEVDVPNPALELTPGMYAQVMFHLQGKQDALLVPASSVLQGDQPAVFVVDADGTVERRTVVLGIASANLQEITSGIAAGDQIAVGELSTLQPGTRVRTQQAPANLTEYQPQAQPLNRPPQALHEPPQTPSDPPQKAGR